MALASNFQIIRKDMNHRITETETNEKYKKLKTKLCFRTISRTLWDAQPEVIADS